jgi:hypothetical protein
LDRALADFHFFWKRYADAMRATWVALVFLFGCASEPTVLVEPTWHPIPGVSVKPLQQSRAFCDPILQQGKIDRAAGGRTTALAQAKEQHRRCMAQRGWLDNPL